VAGSPVDVTARRLAEKRLNRERAQADALCRELARSAPAAIFVDLATGRITQANGVASRYTGYSMAELAGMPFSQLLTPGGRDLFRARLAAMRAGKPFASAVEYQVRVKDGTGLWLFFQTNLVHENNQPARLRTVATDITQRKEVEEALNRREALENVLTTISSNFINVSLEKIENGIQRGLETIGKFAGAQRACIYLVSEDTSHILPAHRWPEGGTAKPHPDLGTLTARTYVWLIDKMKQSAAIHIPDSSVLPEESQEEKELCEKLGARSLILIPLGQFGGPTGMLSFDSTEEPMQWDADIIPLVETAAQVFVNALERKRYEARLQQRDLELDIKSRQLEEVNRALRILLNQSKEDNKNMEQRIVANVQDMVLPYVKRMKATDLSVDQQVYVKVIEENLDEIMSPFMRRIGSKHSNLTPREVEVANLVRMGTTSKEISKLLSISKRAVEFHRDSLRKKLGLKNKKRNLRAYLAQLN
jgi:PAS domain S-box-containing protein